MLTLSFSPKTIVRKNAMTTLLAIVASNAPASAAQMGEPKPKRFEYLDRLRSDVLLSFLEHFGGEQADIDNADDVTVGIDNWEREEFIKHKKLARIEDGSCCRDGNDALHH